MTPLEHIKKVLVANRGEIAVRLIKGCKSLGVKCVSIYSEADATSLHSSLADDNILLSGNGTDAYLNVPEILKICEDCGVDAVIPGYGFLSEDASFAMAVSSAGMVFVGPSPESITEMGQKHRARHLATTAGVPIVPGSELLKSEAEAMLECKRLGLPIMVKASGGGGGMGLQVCHSEEEIVQAFRKVQSRGEALFKNGGVFLEKYFPESRHVEVQVFGNGESVVHFGERECSIQRRHQKLIEECPSPFVHGRNGMRERLTKCAVAYAEQLKYKSAGTVEFLVDNISGDFFFLEMNTRLQVEHGITEMCYGVDLVKLMLKQADAERGGKVGIDGKELTNLQKDGPYGSAIEVRAYAEVPYRNFAPSPGLLQHVKWPEGNGIRVDTWVKTGQRISPNYDPLIAKIMVHDKDRASAGTKMIKVLQEAMIQGAATNLHFLGAVVASEAFITGDTLTNFLDTKFSYKPHAIDVLSPGAFTSVQDYPARGDVGKGIPRGGPMDNVSSRIANILVDNEPGTESLELTLSGPELLFTAPAVFSVCGAPMPVTIDGQEKPMWSRLVIHAGQKLKIGKITNAGCRAYLAIKGGFPEIPEYLGSKSATPSLGLGGTQGRQLQIGDYLDLHDRTYEWADIASKQPIYTFPKECIPDYDIKEVYVMNGPHDSDDIMTANDREMLYSTSWKIGHNSNRTGVRLVGPKPEWARKDGGEGGSHPSNIFDFCYPSPGGINWGGDSPVVFGNDSPDLGGLICSSTVISGDLWRLGQVRPGGTLKLRPTTFENATELARRVERFVKSAQESVSRDTSDVSPLSLELPKGSANAILKTVEAKGERPKIVYRQGGDSFLLVEVGHQTIDIMLTVRVRLLTQKIQELNIDKLVVKPNVLSVMIQYDASVISQQDLLSKVSQIEESIEATPDIKIPSREIHLPLVLDHPEIQASVQRYMETTRPTAAYLPDNVEYLANNNGYSNRREVFESALASPFLIVAVGFLVGTPILFPLQPGSRIVGQKYNPTRVSTPGGTLGIAGSLFAIYPIEAPGGYMLLARTIEAWDTFGTKPGYSPTRPWLYEPFDVVHWHEVSVKEYDALMALYRAGKYEFDIRPSEFNVAEAIALTRTSSTSDELTEFKRGQAEGTKKMLEIENRLYSEWMSAKKEEEKNEAENLKRLAEGGPAVTIDSPIDANVWKVLVEPGDLLKQGQTVAILEAMKMEINVVCSEEASGTKVEAIASKPGSVVAPGAWIIVAKRVNDE